MRSSKVVLFGFITGISTALWAQLNAGGARVPVSEVWIRALIAGVAGAVALFAARLGVHRIVARARLSPATRARYDRWEQWTYAAFAITGLTAFGLLLIAPVVVAIVALFLVLQWVLLWPRREGESGGVAVGVPFFLSGAAALMYQVVWQRLLFAAVGVNIEAVTLIVAIFMLGLGVGAIVGGQLSIRFAERLTAVFAALELGIATFGVVSFKLIAFAADLSGAASLPVVALTLMLLLLPPTVMMGATLPILVAHVNRRYADVGRSIGLLYFVNTLGSATACFVTVLVLFAFVGLHTTALVAVALNVIVAVLVSATLVRPRAARG